MTDPSSLLPDARGGGVLCFCASDAGVPPEGAVQTKHGWAGTLHLPVWVSAAGKEEAVQSINEHEACSVRLIHRGAANHLSKCPLHMPSDCIYLRLMIFLFSSIPGATSRAERAFSVPEFPHIHVRLLLVPDSFPHLSPSACRHTHFWYIHVWGRKYMKYTHKWFFMYLMCLTVYFQHMY